MSTTTSTSLIALTSNKSDWYRDNVTCYALQTDGTIVEYTGNMKARVGYNGSSNNRAFNILKVKLPYKDSSGNYIRPQGFSDISLCFDNAYWGPEDGGDTTDGLFKFSVSTTADLPSSWTYGKTGYQSIVNSISNCACTENAKCVHRCFTVGYNSSHFATFRAPETSGEFTSIIPRLGNVQQYLWLYLAPEFFETENTYKLFFFNEYSNHPSNIYVNVDGAAICTVTFNANGGTPSSSDKELTCGGTYGTLPTVTRTGYTFNGWYTAATGGTNVTASSTVPPQTTQTLYAHWTPIQYQVNYNGNESTSGSMSNSTHTYDQSKKLTANKFSRSYTITYNYNGSGSSNTTATAKATFNGWAESAGGTKKYDDEASVINLRTTAGTFNLYANWTLSSVTLPTPTRTGYTFKGWATSSTATSGSTGSYTPTKDVTLYAVWKANTYIVTFNANGGTPETQAKSIDYDSNYILPSKDPTRTGYKFNGWWTKTYGGSQVTSTTKLETASNHILYAHWIENIARIAYKPNSGDEKVTQETLNDSGYIVRDGTPYIQEVSYESKIRTFTLEELGIDWPGHTFRGWAVTKGGTIVKMLRAGEEYVSTMFSHNLDYTLDTSNTEEVECHLWAIWEGSVGYVNIISQTETGPEWKKYTVNICTQTEDGLVWKQYIPHISNGENWNRYDG